jgi:biofilm PGA synthesis N-glycosyltransferase PgaC
MQSKSTSYRNNCKRVILMQTLLYSAKAPRYVIVSPVKDEERYVEQTLRSVTDQNLKPILWLIVDDGSKDRTPELVRSYANSHPFIRLLSHPQSGERQLAFGEVRAFNWGLNFIGSVEYDFIVKLDCDLSFDADYFEQLMERFRQDESLGIASGIYLEQNTAGEWHEIVMPSYHAAGASKLMRRACFEDIGGFIPAPGWDTVDEIKAMVRGWTTTHFNELRMIHHKREGSSIGAVKTGIMHGEAYYRTGGSKIFFLLKVLHRISVRPYFVNAIALIWGYVRALVKRKQLLVTETEARYYKALLLGRLQERVKSLLQKR